MLQPFWPSKAAGRMCHLCMGEDHAQALAALQSKITKTPVPEKKQDKLGGPTGVVPRDLHGRCLSDQPGYSSNLMMEDVSSHSAVRGTCAYVVEVNTMCRVAQYSREAHHNSDNLLGAVGQSPTRANCDDHEKTTKQRGVYHKGGGWTYRIFPVHPKDCLLLGWMGYIPTLPSHSAYARHQKYLMCRLMV